MDGMKELWQGRQATQVPQRDSEAIRDGGGVPYYGCFLP